MPSAKCIVCEKRGMWAAALRQAWAVPRPLELVETRSLQQGWDRLREFPSSCLILQLRTDNVELLQSHLRALSHDDPRAVAVVVGPRCLEASQWLLREAGAIHVQWSPRRLQPLLKLITRHLDSTDNEQATWEQTFRERLPWKPPTTNANPAAGGSDET